MFEILLEDWRLTTALVVAWLPVIFITLIHLFKKKDIAVPAKIMWLIIGLIPVIGLLVYGFINYKNKKSIVWLTLLALGISAFAGWYFVKYLPEHNRRDPNKENGIAVTPQSILQEFQSNEDSASKKYINKTVELTGEVEKAETDETGSTIFLKTNLEGTGVSCRLIKTQNVVPNSTITVKGILTGYVMGQIQISETTVTKGESTIAVKKDSIVATAKDTRTKKSIDTTKAKVENKVFKSSKGQINFKSSTADELIEATNTQVLSTIKQNGEIQIAALIKGFRFENEVMQNHFNEEKYMHSDKFPKAEFKGTITDFGKVLIDKNGNYNVTAKGNLTMHGVTKPVVANGNITVENGKLILKSTFKVHVQDYGVDGSDVAEKIDIDINCSYQ